MQLRRENIRPANLLFAILLLGLASNAAADPWDGPLRVRASHQPLETVADSDFGARETPVAGVLPGGSACLAWRDTRQGGMIMATRVAATGEILDPMGIPIAWGRDHEPLEIMPAAGGCTVVFRERQNYGEGAIVGKFLSWSESYPRPQQRFRFEGYGAAFTSRDGILIFNSSSVVSTEVRLVRNDGTVQTGRHDTIGIQVLDVTDVGAATYLVGISGGEPSLWKLDADLKFTNLPTTVPKSSWLRLFPDGDDGLLLTSTRGSVLEVLRYALDGTIREWKDGSIPNFATVTAVVRHGNDQIILFRNPVYKSSTPGTLVANLSEGLAPKPLILPMLIGLEERSGRRLFLYSWSSQPGSKLAYEVGNGLPTGTTTPLSSTPRPEIISDVASAGAHLAILWTEIGTWENELRLGIATKHEPERFTPIDVGVVDSHRSASVAIRGETLMILWTERNELWYRRIGLDGVWIDPSRQPLGNGRLGTGGNSAAFGIGHGSLIATPDGFATLYGDFETGQLRLAIVAEDGTTTERELPFAPKEVGNWPMIPADPVIVPWEEGYLVAFQSASVAPCRICTCPIASYPVIAVSYDRNWEAMEPVPIDPRTVPFTAYGLDLIAGEGEALLLTDDLRTTIRRDAEGVLRSSSERIDLSRASGVYTEGRYVLAGSRWQSPYTILLVDDPATEPDATYSLIEDGSLSWSYWYQPRLLPIDGGIILFGSEVSANPTEGTVRRLRIHELEAGPPAERRRSVRRQ